MHEGVLRYGIQTSTVTYIETYRDLLNNFGSEKFSGALVNKTLNLDLAKNNCKF